MKTSSYLVSIVHPNSGLLAVLWWSAVIAFVILAPIYLIRARRLAKETSPSEGRGVNVYVAFLGVMALVAIVLLALRVIPGT